MPSFVHIDQVSRQYSVQFLHKQNVYSQMFIFPFENYSFTNTGIDIGTRLRLFKKFIC